MEIIELWNGDTKALVSCDGGWVTNLSDQNGDILYPKRQLTYSDGNERARGGSHVCLPNFVSGGKTGLPQHGFGRTSVWRVTDQNGQKVTLTLNGGAKGYELLQSTLIYELAEHSIIMTLRVENMGNTSLRVAPGFHPYFALRSDEGQVTLDDQQSDLSDFADTLFVQGTSRRLSMVKRTISLTSANLPIWAIWTDQKAPYVCVEPTAGGATFLNDQPTPEELLSPGQVRTYSVTILWQMNNPLRTVYNSATIRS